MSYIALKQFAKFTTVTAVTPIQVNTGIGQGNTIGNSKCCRYHHEYGLRDGNRPYGKWF